MSTIDLEEDQEQEELPEEDDSKEPEIDDEGVEELLEEEL